MLNKNVNSPQTSSMGRLFDGIASLIGLKHKISYHAQAAIALEQLALKSNSSDSYPFVIKNDIIDQIPVIKDIVNDLKSKIPADVIARKFHNTIVDIIISVAEMIRKDSGITNVALTGGVFQNSLLLETSFSRLKEKGFSPIIHQLVPPNDGGISLGQAVYAHFHQV